MIQQTEAFVRQSLSGDSSGHDWWHIHRVRNTAIFLQTKESGDKDIITMAALLHDIADWKFHNGNEKIGGIKAAEFMRSIHCNNSIIEKTTKIIDEVSFKGAGVDTPMSSLEGQIVQDADRLDAIGAIGIARAFAYGGHKGRAIYNPDFKIQLHQSFEEYKKSQGPSINHFYEKLLLLKDRMNTKTAKLIAEKRHAFMLNYLDTFMMEWENKA